MLGDHNACSDRHAGLPGIATQTRLLGQPNSEVPARQRRSSLAAIFAAVLASLPALAAAADSDHAGEIEAGWRTIRQFDCARCHGADYEGSTGPSLVAAARTRTRDEFLRALLDGNIERGMPPYG